MSSKKAKQSDDHDAPPTSTPILPRSVGVFPDLKKKALPKSPNENTSPDSLMVDYSPVAPGMRVPKKPFSPFLYDSRSLFVQSRSSKGLGDASEMLPLIDDVSSRLSGCESKIADHLQHSLSYAKQMEHKASQISKRLNTSANLSMSPRLLFSSANSPVKENPGKRKKTRSIDALTQKTCVSICQQTVSLVDRIIQCNEVCPEIVGSQTQNRFLSKFPQNSEMKDTSVIFNPIFNSSCLFGSYSSLIEISRTPLAVLYKGRHRLTGILHCLKRSRCEFEPEKPRGSTLCEIFNEVQAISMLKHPNIIRYYNSWFEADAIFLQLEFCLGGSLFHYLHPNCSLDTSLPHDSAVNQSAESACDVASSGSPGTSVRCLSETALLVLLAHITSALNYMHTTWSMVHGDVKPSNILIQLKKPEAHLADIKNEVIQEAKIHCHTLLRSGDPTGVVFKLADFGRASTAGEDRDGENLGDGRYLPRLNDPSPPARAAIGRDIYALGISIYHSAGGPMAPSVWERLREAESIPDFSVIPLSLQPIVKSMLRPLAQDRPTATELLGYPSLRPLIHASVTSQKMELS